MKILTNWADSICTDCGQAKTAEQFPNGLVGCSFCYSTNLRTSQCLIFVPAWTEDSRNPTRLWHTAHYRRASDRMPRS
jgi:hypothetical protein